MNYAKVLSFLFILIVFLGCNSNRFADEDKPKRYDKFLDSTSNLIILGDTTLAFHYLDSCYSANPNFGIGDLWKKYRIKQATLLSFADRIVKTKYRLNQALLYADSMIYLLESNKVQKKYNQEYIASIFAKGDVLMSMNRYHESYLYFHKGKIIANQLNNGCEIAKFNTRYASAKYVTEQYASATSFYIQAYQNQLKCSLNFESFAAVQGALDNAGLSYSKINYTDSALICYKKALAYIDENASNFPSEKIFMSEARGVIYNNIGDLYFKNANYDLAELYFKKSWKHLGESEKKTQQLSILKLARLNINEGKFSEAKRLIDLSRKSIDSLSSDRLEMDWNKLNVDYYNATGNYGKASNFLPLYLKLQEKANKQRQSYVDANAESEFYELQKKYELAILKKENQLNDLYLFVAIVFSIMLIVALYQVYRNWGISKINNIQLRKLNDQLNNQKLNLLALTNGLQHSEGENNKIMKVVAHDLRSPLSAIVSLTDLMLSEEKHNYETQELMTMIKQASSDSLLFVDELLNNGTAINRQN